MLKWLHVYTERIDLNSILILDYSNSHEKAGVQGGQTNQTQGTSFPPFKIVSSSNCKLCVKDADTAAMLAWV